MGGATLFEKVWAEHEVADLGDGLSLLHVDRHLMHDLNGMKSLVELRERGLGVRNPELTTATPDHGISTIPGRTDDSNPATTALLQGLREETARAGIRVYDVGQDGQGIVHVMGPELGLTQPGCLIVCGDSHTCTHGGLGALAFGVGRSEVVHVLATQTIYQSRPQQMRVRFDGTLTPHVSPKDLILYLIGKVGAAGGTGCAVEYGGSAIRAMSVEGRLTICNLSIELGAKYGMIAPDDTTVEFIAGRPHAPKRDHWDKAVAYWRTLFSDDDATFHKEVTVDAGAVAPQITWGTSPQHVIAVDDLIPDPARAADAASARHDDGGARLYRSHAGNAHRRHAGRHGVHRLLHQQPPARSAPGGRRRERPQGRCECACLGRARLREGEAGGRGGRPRSRVPRRRLRMA